MIGVLNGDQDSSRYILFVDDEPTILDQAKDFLERIDSSFVIHTVSSAEKALELMDEKNFDCIVSDFHMPEMDGLELLDFVRNELNSDIPFIIFTALGREEVAMDAYDLGAERFLQKMGTPRAQYQILASIINQEIDQWEKNQRSCFLKNRYKILLDSINQQLLIVDTDCAVVSANSFFLDKNDLKKTELFRNGLDSLFSIKTLKKIEKKIDRSVKENKKSRLKVVKKTKRNTENYIIDMEPFKTPYSDVVDRVLIKINNATEKEETIDKLYKIMNNSPNGIIIYDRDGFVLEANSKAYKLLGYSSEEIHNLDISDLIHEFNDKNRFKEYFNQKNSEKNFEDNLRYIKNDGTEIKLKTYFKYTKINRRNVFLSYLSKVDED